MGLTSTTSVSTLPSTQSTLTPITTGVTNTVGSATTALTGTATTVGSKVSGLVSSATSEVSAITSGLQDSVSKTMDALTGGLNTAFNDITGSAFTDTTKANAIAKNSKTGVPDPVKSSFAKQTPNSSLIKTTSATTGLAPHTVTAQKKSSSDQSILGSLPVLVKKYGTDLISNGVSGVRSLVNSVTKSEMVQGLYSGIKTTYATGMQVKNTITGTISSVEGTVSSVVQGSLSEYHSLMGGVASAITGSANGLSSLLNGSLASTAGVDGIPINGVPSGTDPTALSNIIKTAKSLGCNIDNIDYTAYGAQQSAYGALLGLSAQMDMTSILTNLMHCNRFDGYGIDIAKDLFYQKAGTNAGTANTLLQGVGASNIAVTPELGKLMATNQNLTTADASSLTSMFSALHLDTESPFKTGTSIAGNDVWDIKTLTNSVSAAKTTLISSTNSSISSMIGGFSIDI